MKLFYRSLVFLGLLSLVLLNIGCNTTQKFTEIGDGLAKNISQLSKEPGITLTGFSSDPDKRLFKVGIGVDRNKITNDRLKQAIESYLSNSASLTTEHDPKKLLEPYNLQIEEISKDRLISQLIAEKPAGSTEISWKNLNATP